jgi:hypothetical protein
VRPLITIFVSDSDLTLNQRKQLTIYQNYSALGDEIASPSLNPKL